jgi:hypothetical protein
MLNNMQMNKIKQVNLGKRESVDLTLNKLRIWSNEYLHNHELHSNDALPGI